MKQGSGQIQGSGAMFYTLGKKWRLCGWKGLPFALENTQYGSAIFFDREQYSFLLDCDGMHDLEIAGYSETARRMIGKLMEEGIVTESEESRLAERAEYVLYPVAYRKKAHWSITGRCNYKCRHCLMSAPEGRFPHPSFAQLLFIADRLKECGVLSVDLTGGEPLIRPDFPDLVDALRTRGISIGTIFTNGKLVTRKLLEELKCRGVRCSFQISFDGVGGWHDWMRGIDGASEDAARAIRLCVEYGFRVTCAMCLHKESVSVLQESVRYLAGLGVNLLKVNAAVLSGDWKKHSEYSLSTRELFEVFLEYIPQYFEDDCPLDIELDIFFQYNRGDREYTNGADRDPGISPEKCLACRSTKLNFYIASDGGVVPCMAMAGTAVSKQFYNIFETDLKEILGDDSRLTKAGERTFREILDHNPECGACPHAPVCQGGCRARATGELYDDYLRPDPINCEFLKGAWRERIKETCDGAFEAYKQRMGIG